MDETPETVVVETPRLRMRRLTARDAPFILELVNEPAFLRNIGDKGVRDVEGAERYLAEGPVASYGRHGFGMYRVELRDTAEPVGMCGLLKRDVLDHADIGFAFLARHHGMGYASEAAGAVLAHERRALGVGRVLAVVNPDNAGSIRVLTKVGFRPEGNVRLTPDGMDLVLLANGVSTGGDTAPSPL